MLSFDGTYDVPHPRDQVWAALNRPDILKQTIPGCEDLAHIAPGSFQADIALKFGLLRFRTQGHLRVEVLQEARSYRLHGGSQPSLFGSGQGIADVELDDLPDGGTHVRYRVQATLQGRLAKLGAALVSGQLQRLGDRFFDRFVLAMDQDLET